jgi:DnaJ-class molecular chaperone
VDEISKAYRKLARFCHPDKVGSMSEQDAARAEKAYEALRKAKECLSKDDTRGPYVREHCQFLKPDTKALEITSTDFTSSADRFNTARQSTYFVALHLSCPLLISDTKSTCRSFLPFLFAPDLKYPVCHTK